MNRHANRVFDILKDYQESLYLSDIDIAKFAEIVSEYLDEDKKYTERQICTIAKDLYRIELLTGNLDMYKEVINE